MSMFEINRPVAFFDLEATGKDPEEARIIEIGIQRLVPEDHEEADRVIEDGVATGRNMTRLINPGIPVPEEVQNLTGITTQDVGDKPSFEDLTPEIGDMIGDADLAGFNCLSYDIPLLKTEYDRLSLAMPGPKDRSVVDVYKIEKALQSRSLEALHRKYHGKEIEGSHRALADVEATVNVLKGQLDKYAPEENDPKSLEKLVRGDHLDHDGKLLSTSPDNITADTVLMDFGKHSGETVQWVWDNDRGYMEWAMKEIDEISDILDKLIRTNSYSRE